MGIPVQCGIWRSGIWQQGIPVPPVLLSGDVLLEIKLGGIRCMCGRYFVDDGMSEEVKRLVCGLKKEDAGKPGNIYNAGNSETARVAGARSAYEGDAARTAGIGGIRDVCPSQQAAVLAADPNLPGTVMVKQMIWGFPGIQNKGLLINARAETALQKRRTGTVY